MSVCLPKLKARRPEHIQETPPSALVHGVLMSSPDRKAGPAEKIILFFGGQSVFSNWYPCKFVLPHPANPKSSWFTIASNSG